jgi:glycosyltransferase involved in cell wall biosynthesis
VHSGTVQVSERDLPWLEIVVPAHNEEFRLAAGLDLLVAKAALLPVAVEILVVDSASTDQTAQIVLGRPAGPVPVRLIRCDQPGKGIAVRAGLLATQAPYVGFCDADMASDVSGLDLAVATLLSGYQVVIGSRAHPQSQVEVRHSIVRKAGAALFRTVARTITPEVGDTQCGFKFFAGPVVRQAAGGLTARGFAFDIELLARCRNLGADLAEIPVSWRDMPGSTFSVWRHSVSAFAEVAEIWLTLRRQQAGHRGATPEATGPGYGPALGAVVPAGIPAGIEAAGPS